MVKCSSVKVMHRGNLNHLKNRLLLFTVLIYGDISKDQHLCGVVRTPTVVFPVCFKMLDDVEVRVCADHSSFFSALRGVQINRHFDMLWGGCSSGGHHDWKVSGLIPDPSVCMPGILGQDTNPQLFYILHHLHVSKLLNHNIYDIYDS